MAVRVPVGAVRAEGGQSPGGLLPGALALKTGVAGDVAGHGGTPAGRGRRKSHTKFHLLIHSLL